MISRLTTVPALAALLLAATPALFHSCAVDPVSDKGRSLKLDFHNRPDGDGVFEGYRVTGATGGDYSGPGEGDGQSWTWQSAVLSADQTDIRVYDHHGELVMTLESAGSKPSGSNIIDGPTSGDFGGNWNP